MQLNPIKSIDIACFLVSKYYIWNVIEIQTDQNLYWSNKYVNFLVLILSPQRKKAIDLQDKLRSASTESLYPTALRVSTKSKKTRPKTPFYEVRESPINKGSATPAVKYVYLSQNRPKPIDPLKVVWIEFLEVDKSIKYHKKFKFRYIIM